MGLTYSAEATIRSCDSAVQSYQMRTLEAAFLEHDHFGSPRDVVALNSSALGRQAWQTKNRQAASAYQQSGLTATGNAAQH